MYSPKTFAAILGVASVSNAHMLLSTPTRFSTPSIDNGPLLADGSNFPCKTTGGTFAGDTTSMALGSTQPLAFTGGATHGGGSCQISISYDVSPTKSSVWKVIHSIEGGCPVKDTAGNIGSDASAADPFTYTFPVPSNIPTGKATIAWSWINRIGNREFYMNCGAIELTGTSGDQANYDALPDMLVANIAANGGATCATEENFDYMYPNPGPSVDRFNMTVLKYPTGAGCGTPGSSGSSSSGSGSGSASSAVSSAAAPATSAAAPKSSAAASVPGGVFITQSSAAAASSPAATTPVAQSPTTSAAAQATPTSSSGTGSGSGTGTTTTTGAQTVGAACTTEGEWNCVGGSSFQRCASGTWSAVMQMAAGTTCTEGQSAAINIVTSTGKERRFALRFRG